MRKRDKRQIEFQRERERERETELERQRERERDVKEESEREREMSLSYPSTYHGVLDLINDKKNLIFIKLVGNFGIFKTILHNYFRCKF